MIFTLFFLAKAEEQFLLIFNLNLPIHDNYVKTSLQQDCKNIKIHYSGLIEQYPLSAERFDHLEFENEDQYNIYSKDVQNSKQSLTCFDQTQTKVSKGINMFEKKTEENVIFVLDNTYLPCDGVAYDKITPWITILLQFHITKIYFYIKIFLILLIILTSVILSIAIILIQWEIRKLDKKIQNRSSFPRILQNLQIK